MDWRLAIVGGRVPLETKRKIACSGLSAILCASGGGGCVAVSAAGERNVRFRAVGRAGQPTLAYLADDVDKLADSEVCRDEEFLLVDERQCPATREGGIPCSGATGVSRLRGPGSLPGYSAAPRETGILAPPVHAAGGSSRVSRALLDDDGDAVRVLRACARKQEGRGAQCSAKV